LIPEGVLETLPAPLPARETVSANVCTAKLKVAVTESLLLAPIVTEQASVPEQAPPHPAKTDPAAGLAARLTDVPEGKSELHVFPQLMPEGVLETVPAPDPEMVTARGRLWGFWFSELGLLPPPQPTRAKISGRTHAAGANSLYPKFMIDPHKPVLLR